MTEIQNGLEEIASKRRIMIHEPFAEFLMAKPILHTFEISLLDCYRFAGHACKAITGAFLVTEAAVKALYPENYVCIRGDLAVDFGATLEDHPTGPRSNVISFITGAWSESGFAGLKGRFVRKNILTYGHPEVPATAIRFRRLSNGEHITVEYNPSLVTNELDQQFSFPESWRYEVCEILENSDQVLNIIEKKF